MNYCSKIELKQYASTEEFEKHDFDILLDPRSQTQSHYLESGNFPIAPCKKKDRYKR